MLRLDVPGHQASTHAQPGLADFLGIRTLELDVPPLTQGVDYGDAPTPLGQAAYLAAQAWGGSPHLVPHQRRQQGQPRRLPRPARARASASCCSGRCTRR